MPKAFVITLLVILCSVAVARPADAVDELSRARSFCMLCATATGRVVSGDQAFITILRGKDAAAQLQAVFDRGNLEGKMYALAGLREIDRTRFNSDLHKLGAPSGFVTVCFTEHPPSVLRRSAESVLRHIKAGSSQRIVLLMRANASPDGRNS